MKRLEEIGTELLSKHRTGARDHKGQYEGRQQTRTRQDEEVVSHLRVLVDWDWFKTAPALNSIAVAASKSNHRARPHEAQLQINDLVRPCRRWLISRLIDAT